MMNNLHIFYVQAKPIPKGGVLGGVLPLPLFFYEAPYFAYFRLLPGMNKTLSFPPFLFTDVVQVIIFDKVKALCIYPNFHRDGDTTNVCSKTTRIVTRIDRIFLLFLVS